MTSGARAGLEYQLFAVGPCQGDGEAHDILVLVLLLLLLLLLLEPDCVLDNFSLEPRRLPLLRLLLA